MAETKKLPIIFSAESVHAILAGRKTQTRRVMKIQPPEIGLFQDRSWICGKNNIWMDGCGFQIKCPYAVGDILWAKETWDIFAIFNEITSSYEVPSICYKATNTAIPIIGKIGYKYQREDNSHKWRSPRFMPRWASRIILEIISVKIERLQDILEEDAIAEGVEYLFTEDEIKNTVGLKKPQKEWGYKNYLWHGLIGSGISQKQSDQWDYQFSNYKTARDSYSSLWDSINGKKYPRESNPWVWAIEFKRIDN
jgi:hypothetical protein